MANAARKIQKHCTPPNYRVRQKYHTGSTIKFTDEGQEQKGVVVNFISNGFFYAATYVVEVGELLHYVCATTILEK